ncbi:MAG: fused MFS/spermidine synthase [Rothia sp. (in: high G+C Gram-positive bacteria)]|nr:fused MFS/spermidine synthase [Rothia sp. (in: high G+C Gram-positive bacteria)]
MLSRTIQLSFSGLSARIVPDDFSESGFILEIGGAEQSHVNLAHPEEIFYEYLRRIANVIDVFRPAEAPISVAHLGAGALTLARYIQATRPGSAQVAVDIERELPTLVLDHLSMPAGSQLEVIIDDARAAISQLAPALSAVAGIDAIIVDIFSGWGAPEHLIEPGFYKELKAELADSGVLLVNVGDDPGFTFFAAQARTLLNTFEHVWCLTEQSLLNAKHAGNMILVGTQNALDADTRARLAAAGPHPGVVLDTHELAEWVNDLG